MALDARLTGRYYDMTLPHQDPVRLAELRLQKSGTTLSATNWSNMRWANKRAGSMPDRLSGEWLNWCQAKERIGQQLRQYYSACMTEEMSPRLIAALKELDEETEARDIKS